MIFNGLMVCCSGRSRRLINYASVVVVANGMVVTVCGKPLKDMLDRGGGLGLCTRFPLKAGCDSRALAKLVLFTPTWLLASQRQNNTDSA